MQLLTFTFGDSPYAIEARRIVEVLPLVAARPLPHMPDHVCGLFTYRGSLVPLIELGRLLGVGPAPAILSTRIIVVSLDEETGVGLPIRDHACRLGLVAPHVIAIQSADEAATVLPRLALRSAPYLGRVLRLGSETVQVLDVDQLLSDDLRAGLFPARAPEGRR